MTRPDDSPLIDIDRTSVVRLLCENMLRTKGTIAAVHSSGQLAPPSAFALNNFHHAGCSDFSPAGRPGSRPLNSKTSAAGSRHCPPQRARNQPPCPCSCRRRRPSRRAALRLTSVSAPLSLARWLLTKNSAPHFRPIECEGPLARAGAPWERLNFGSYPFYAPRTSAWPAHWLTCLANPVEQPWPHLPITVLTAEGTWPP